MRLNYFLLVFAGLAFSGFRESAPAETKDVAGKKELRVSFYNVENLFDTIDTPDKSDEEFTPGGANSWNAQRYYQKLDQLSLVISSMHEGKGPDILGVSEIENEAVLLDLAAHKLLKKKKYRVVHTESPDKRGIDVALLVASNVKVAGYYSYPVQLPDTSEKTRDILWVNIISPSKENLWVGVCHFPSRSGGEEISKPKRAAAALTVKKVADSLNALNIKWLIMGDFNDEPRDSSMYHILNARGSTAESPQVNLMLALKDSGIGSYKYKDQWNMLDQFVLSGNLYSPGKGWSYVPGSVNIFSAKWMKEKEGKFAGNPWRTYAGKKYLGGFSDHFPVELKLKF